MKRPALVPSLDWQLALGVVFLVFGLTWLLSPGRIDTIDAQWRFEVAHSLLEFGDTLIRDPVLQKGTNSVRPWIAPDGSYHFVYGLGGSFAGLFFMALGRTLGLSGGDLLHHLFGLATPFFHALTCGVLFAFFRRLKLNPRAAVVGALAYGLCSYGLAVSATYFDQTQRGFWLILAYYLAFASRQRGHSLTYALLAGLAGGATVHYNELMLALFPFAALLFWPHRRDRRQAALKASATFALGAALMVVLYLYSNELRFGHPLFGRFGQSVGDRVAMGGGEHNVLIGLVGLFVSPGKGLLFYGPPSVLALWGVRRLWNSQRLLIVAIAVPSALYLYATASKSFWGGDWCWGPRFLAVLLPLWFLAWARLRLNRHFVGAVLALGMLVQALGLSLDMHRFYIERAPTPHFWESEPTFHFKTSMLFSRPFDLVESVERTAQFATVQAHHPFRPGPYPESKTYALFSGSKPIGYFRVFWYAKPWPFWTQVLREDEQDSAYRLLIGAALTFVLIGGLLAADALASAAPRRSD